MRVQVYKLFRDGPIIFHMGKRRMDRTLTYIPSDTLYSSLCNSYIKLFREDGFKEFSEEILISSVFIGLRDNERDILLVPMPHIPLKLKDEFLDKHKKLKKIQWISLNALEKILKYVKKENNEIYLDINLKEISFLNSQTLVSKEEFENIGEEIEFLGIILEPKVLVPREKGETTLYFQENVELSPVKTQNGKTIIPFLYFFSKKEERLEKKLKATINLLLEEGLGGERNTGKGTFDYYEVQEIDFPDEGEYEITLSLTSPKREEVNNLIFFQIVKRDGFIYHNEPKGLRKKTHYKIAEGALVKSPYDGENLNVSPDNNIEVISYGKAFSWKFLREGDLL